MTAREADTAAVECLAAAGLPAREVRDWLQAAGFGVAVKLAIGPEYADLA